MVYQLVNSLSFPLHPLLSRSLHLSSYFFVRFFPVVSPYSHLFLAARLNDTRFSLYDLARNDYKVRESDRAVLFETLYSFSHLSTSLSLFSHVFIPTIIIIFFLIVSYSQWRCLVKDYDDDDALIYLISLSLIIVVSIND